MIDRANVAPPATADQSTGDHTRPYDVARPGPSTLPSDQQARRLPNDRPARPSRWRRRIRFAVRATALSIVLLVVYVGVTFVQVVSTSRHDDAPPVQAIIVLGAAQYNGRPSPVLAARLDHAADLYAAGVAPLVVVTGGRQPGDQFTEAEASANYLMDHGVPGGAIERETTSTNSYDELAVSAAFLKERGVTEVVLVSDPFHAHRIGAIADDVGLDAHVSPTRTSPVSGAAELRALVRETVAVSVGRIIGYGTADDVDKKLRG